MHWHSPELASKQKSQMTVLRVAVPTPLLLSLSRIEAIRSALWSSESEALRSTVHYGPLKMRLYHKSKALWSAESEANNHDKISNFRPFLIYLDYELLLRSLRSKNSLWLQMWNLTITQTLLCSHLINKITLSATNPQNFFSLNKIY